LRRPIQSLRVRALLIRSWRFSVVWPRHSSTDIPQTLRLNVNLSLKTGFDKAEPSRLKALERKKWAQTWKEFTSVKAGKPTHFEFEMNSKMAVYFVKSIE
jgi:hypothetical protein